MYRDPAVDEKPALLAKRGGAFYSEAAVELLASLVGGRADAQVVNLATTARCPSCRRGGDRGPPRSAARASRAGRAPPVPAQFRGLIAHVSAYEELALDAARRGGRDRVAEALLAHPLIGQYDLADRLADALIDANRQHLAWAGASAAKRG